MDAPSENESAFLPEDGFMHQDGGTSRSGDEDCEDSDDNVKREPDLDGGGDSGGEGGHSSLACALREQDRFLPIANITRIMKRAIPKTGKIAKDARECVQEAVSEFVSFITSEASDRCLQEKRKTINGEDVLFAMSGLGFDDYVEPLKLYLQRYREVMKGEKPGTEGFEEGLSDGITVPRTAVLAPDGTQVVYFQEFPQQ